MDEISPVSTRHHRYFNQFDTDGVRDVIKFRSTFDAQSERVTERVRTQKQIRDAAKRKKRIIPPRRPKVTLNVPVILPEVLNLPRLPETGPLDGCAKIHKGLTESGGFFVFTCEKLRPNVPIDQHGVLAHRYRVLLRDAGWKKAPTLKTNTTKHDFRDASGCRKSVEVTVWDDRLMGEPVLNRNDRSTFRQIVFLTTFSGRSCKPYYEIIQTLSKMKYQ